MVNTTCAVRECLTSSRTNKEIRFHQFPQSEERIKQWLVACDRADLYKKSHESLRYTYVCSLHFEPRMYGRSSLKKHAAPTLHLPGKEMTSIPTQTETLYLLKCNPVLPTTFTTEIDGRAIISKVYHYLERQYEHLKTLTDNQAALTPLSNILKSTSSATGIHETLVKHIIEQELLLGSVTRATEQRVKMHQNLCMADRPQIQYHVHTTKASSSSSTVNASVQNNGNKEQERSICEDNNGASDPIKYEPAEPKESSAPNLQSTPPDTSDVVVKMETESRSEECGLVIDYDPLDTETDTAGQHQGPVTSPVAVKTEPTHDSRYQDHLQSLSTTDHASPSLTALTEMEIESTADGTSQCCTSVYLVASDKPQAKPKTKRSKQAEMLHISTEKRAQIIALYKQNIAISEIARRLKLTLSGSS